MCNRFLNRALLSVVLLSCGFSPATEEEHDGPEPGTWELVGKDSEQWKGSLVVTNRNGANFEAYCDWSSSSGSNGRELFKGSFDPASRSVTLQGIGLQQARGIGLGTYEGKLSKGGKSITGGTWSGSGGVTGTWSATWKNTKAEAPKLEATSSPKADDFSMIKGPATLIRTNGFRIRGNLRSMNSKQVRITPSGSSRITELKASDVKEIHVAGETYTYNTESRTFESEKALAEAALERQLREQREADERRNREQEEARERQIRERDNAIVDWTEKRDGVEDALVALSKVFGKKAAESDQATVLGIAGKAVKAAEAEDHRVKSQEDTGYRNPILSRKMRFAERQEIMERVHKVTLARESITIYESGGGVIRNVIPGENGINGRHTFWTKQGKMFLCFSSDGAGFLIPMLEVLGLESNGELLYGERTPEEQQKSVVEKHQMYFSRWKDAAREATRLKRQMVADSGAALAEGARRSFSGKGVLEDDRNGSLTLGEIGGKLGAKGTNSGGGQATSSADSKQGKTSSATKRKVTGLLNDNKGKPVPRNTELRINDLTDVAREQFPSEKVFTDANGRFSFDVPRHPNGPDPTIEIWLYPNEGKGQKRLWRGKLDNDKSLDDLKIP